MRITLNNGRVNLLLIFCLLAGCQSAQKMNAESKDFQAKKSIVEREPRVLHDMGPVTVLAGEDHYFTSAENIQEKERIQKSGYNPRNAPDIVKLRHAGGATASVSYFTEVTDDAIGTGVLKYRKSGDAKALVKIDDQYVGECTFRHPVTDIATVSYSRPEALKDGEEVLIGSVKVGTKQLEVVSNCRHLGNQGVVSVFFNGQNRLICHEYRHDGHIVARRTRSPKEETVEFASELSDTEQLCIAADTNFRLNEERTAKAKANIVYMPVYR